MKWSKLYMLDDWKVSKTVRINRHATQEVQKKVIIKSACWHSEDALHYVSKHLVHANTFSTLTSHCCHFGRRQGELPWAIWKSPAVLAYNKSSQLQKKYLHYNSPEAYSPLRERPKSFETPQIAVIISFTNRLSFRRCSMRFQALREISRPPPMSTFWQKNMVVMFFGAATCPN